jgi:hypothetical protein
MMLNMMMKRDFISLSLFLAYYCLQFELEIEIIRNKRSSENHKRLFISKILAVGFILGGSK